MKETILIVDDEKKARQGLRLGLEGGDREIHLAESADQALGIIRKHNIDLMITDIKMPGMDGMQLLEEVKDKSPSTDVVVVTGYGSVEQAVVAMREGAYDYLLKPVNLNELDLLVRKVAEKKNLELKGELYERQARGPIGMEGLIGTSPVMREIFEKTKRVAKSNITVLLTGESGTGKELVARAVHQLSDRSSTRFVPVNCSALAETLLESELFGHERGAFTGAFKQKKGYFEIANGGTLFLDEIAEMSHTTQVKLLRILESKEFERVGGTATVKVDVRLVVATNADLAAVVKVGKFREDLYYRLQGVTIHLPPLRDRKEDIPLLVRHFVETFARENGNPDLGIDSDVVGTLARMEWPGNVRQLRNTLESLVVLSKLDRITMEDLPSEVRGLPAQASSIVVPLGTPLHEVERRVILETLEDQKGNRTRTAEVLKIGRRTLIRKLQEYGSTESSRNVGKR